MEHVYKLERVYKAEQGDKTGPVDKKEQVTGQVDKTSRKTEFRKSSQVDKME